MSVKNTKSDSQVSIESIRTQCSEDPRREPREKETSLHVEGDGTHFVVRSFKRVVFEKLLQRPKFDLMRLHVIDDNGREQTMDSLDKAAEQSLTIIGVTGKIPVGAINIGTPRNSNSHADIVK